MIYHWNCHVINLSDFILKLDLSRDTHVTSLVQWDDLSIVHLCIDLIFAYIDICSIRTDLLPFHWLKNYVLIGRLNVSYFRLNIKNEWSDKRNIISIPILPSLLSKSRFISWISTKYCLCRRTRLYGNQTGLVSKFFQVILVLTGTW